MVPFLDVSAAYQELKDDIDQAVQTVLQSGLYIMGPEVEDFETDWAKYCGTSHAVGVANGLDAIILSLRALGIGRGDEVIVPSNTYIATWLAVSAVGAMAVPVEPIPATYNIDPERIEAAITPRTAAIIPVHLYGQPADLEPILSVARAHGLSVIEDAAQAHGATHSGQRIGGHGDIACWSFYPGKNLGALGDGGAVTTNCADLAERVRLLRNYGSRQKYVHEEQGTNSRLDPLQAAVLKTKLEHLDDWTHRRREVARTYSEGLKDLNFVLPDVPQWADPVWHLYVIRTSDRDRLQSELKARGVSTLIHYPIPPHKQAAYAPLGISPESLPIARDLSQEVLSLPIGPHLSADAAAHVVDSLHAVV